jgi:hypothetical protein
MPPENVKLYNVRVRPSLWEAAKAIAEAKGDRISGVVRDLLTEYVRKNRKVLEQAEEPTD